MTGGFHFDHQSATAAFTPPADASAAALDLAFGVALAFVAPVGFAATKRSCPEPSEMWAPVPLLPVPLILSALLAADVRLVRLEPGRREDADRRDPGRWAAESLLTRPIVPNSGSYLAD